MDAEYDDVVKGLKDGFQQAINAGPGRQITLQLQSTRGRSYSVPVTVPTTLDQNQWASAVAAPIFVARCAAYNAQSNCQGDLTRVPLLMKTLRLFSGRILADISPAATPSASTQLAQSTLATVPPQIVTQAQRVASQVQQTGQVPQIVTPTWIQQNSPPLTAPPVGVIPYGATQNFAPVATNLPPQQDATAGILQSLLSMQSGSQAASMVSPPAQALVAQVAAEGVQQTPQGPPQMPKWLLPVGIGAGALLLVLLMKRK
jgi:hypothetical protein